MQGTAHGMGKGKTVEKMPTENPMIIYRSCNTMCAYKENENSRALNGGGGGGGISRARPCSHTYVRNIILCESVNNRAKCAVSHLRQTLATRDPKDLCFRLTAAVTATAAARVRFFSDRVASTIHNIIYTYIYIYIRNTRAYIIRSHFLSLRMAALSVGTSSFTRAVVSKLFTIAIEKTKTGDANTFKSPRAAAQWPRV